MREWNKFLKGVLAHLERISSNGCDMPYFRGHAVSRWDLLCGLGRQPQDKVSGDHIESILYYDFLSLGGGLLGRNASSWDVLFAMQHHGLPTRLLDWTTTFSSALYFALRPYLFLDADASLAVLPEEPCIWILDPFELNNSQKMDSAVINPYTDFVGDYQEYFIDKSKKLNVQAVSVNPPQHTPRQSAQRSVFTLHSDIFTSLEEIAGNCVRKFPIPVKAGPQAVAFLKLAGANEFSAFPDLDGLARHLKGQHVAWQRVAL